MSVGFGGTVPVSAPEFEVRERPTWPKVVGIISIVWGSIWMLCGACGAVTTLGAESLVAFGANMQAQSGAPAGAQAQLPTTPMPAELKPNLLSILALFGAPVVAILLIVAGILLVRRRVQSRGLHMGYAVLSGGLMILGILGAIQQADAMKIFIAAQPDDPWAQFFQASGGGSGQLMNTFIISAMSMAYPVFCLIWFGAVKRNPHDLDSPIGGHPA